MVKLIFGGNRISIRFQFGCENANTREQTTNRKIPLSLLLCFHSEAGCCAAKAALDEQNMRI